MPELATCNRCGETNVAWVQSKRTGKWYLAEAYRYHGQPADMNGRAIPGGVAVRAHEPHRCDEARPVCARCTQRHAPGSTQTCDLGVRRLAMANPVWDVFEGKRGTVRHTLDAGDIRAEVEHFPGEPILLRVAYQGQAVEIDGQLMQDFEVASFDAGRELAEKYVRES
jgi:hypothetical protein